MDFSTLSQILGGIGLFLLGMILLTDGLKTVAGDSLRLILTRFTGGSTRAFATGMGLTCLVQSSSATVLATIGFVSAGLLSFPQAVGVVLGAAVGTTSTGWIVSVLGLKFSISIIALPLVGLGALARLLLGGRLSSAGIAIAGFGLIFIGIDVLRGGMGGLGTMLDPTRFAGDALLGRLLLVALGIAMTVIMQSSSAAVVMTLAAFDAGTITLDQGAALVIGQSMGTAVTAAIATIGASAAARRTAMAHILFNIFAGILGFIMLPLFLYIARWLAEQQPGEAAFVSPVALAAFHTSFTLLAAAMVLPVTGRYAKLIVRVVRERGPVLTTRLDPTVRNVPEIAVEAARLTLLDVAGAVIEGARLVLSEPGSASAAARLSAAESALGELREFLTGVGMREQSAQSHRELVSSLHAMDHLSRLVGVVEHPPAGKRRATGAEIQRGRERLEHLLTTGEAWLSGDHGAPPPEIETVSRELAEMRRKQRIATLQQTAEGRSGPGDALIALDAMRWLDRIGYHIWRITHHLQHPAPPVESERNLEEADPQ